MENLFPNVPPLGGYKTPKCAERAANGLFIGWTPTRDEIGRGN